MSDGVSEAGRESDQPIEEQQAQIKYGISLFEMDDDSIVVNVHGTPDMGHLQRLLAGALANLEADIVARKVLQAISEQKSQSRIVRPGM